MINYIFDSIIKNSKVIILFNIFLRIIAIVVSPGNKKVDLFKNNMYWNIMQYVEFTQNLDIEILFQSK